MNKFTFLAFTTFLLFGYSNINAQQKAPVSTSVPTHRTCATDEVMLNLLSQDPVARQRYDAMQRMFNEKLAQIANNRQNRINAITTVPVVIHIGLPDPNLVTDATVLNQLDTLNWAYGNAPLTDSLRTYTPFRTTYGRSEIRFCLAQRTPTNLPTNGIERIVNNTVFSGVGAHPSTQIPAWDPTKYLNIWVVQLSGGELGYSYTPGAFAPNDQRNGFVNDYRAFGSGPSTSGGGYLFNGFNGGKTAVHEIGHFFNLFHPWSDASNAGSNPGCTLSDGCADTPPTDGPTFGCPPAPVLNTCSPTEPGVMWQNYMDYADDVCMTLFTQNQAARMNSAIVSLPDRVGLSTSNGCIPLTLTANNASISTIVTPPAGFVTCDLTIPLTVTLRNAGSNPLTSVTITVTRNATPIQTFNWTGNLTSLGTVSVPLNLVSLVSGANAIQVCTSNPNGVADSDPADDCSIVNITRGTGIPLPLVEGFESATFPPAGWIINNPDGAITWERTTASIAHTGTGNAYVNHFDYATVGEKDDLRTPPYVIGTADSLWVSFWAAYRGDPRSPFDQFQVMVSSDCGQTFQVVYDARNDTAFVAPAGATASQTTAFFPSALNQWIKKSIDLSNFIQSSNVIVQFRAINQFGNNMHLDDINLDKKVFFNNDAGVIAVNKPAGRICTSSDAPVAVIKNYGKINLTSVKINYQVDGTGPITTFNWTGNLSRNQTATVTLATANFGAVGNHSINVYTTLPNNVTDEDPGNDGLVKAYIVSQIFTLPKSVTEEFTSITFPPTNWFINNPNGDITWQRNGSIGNKNAGSAYFNDFANTTVDRFDDLVMPNYSYSGIDSIFLAFNLAHITRTLPGTTGSRLDTLTVLLSKDCGNTFTTVYKKYGEELQTVNDPNFQISMSNFIPLVSQWRRDSVNLGKWLGATEPLFQLKFRFSGNMENNFYLDDVNIRSQILPAKLKNDGYLVLPNPFRNTFGVWHYQVPTTLRYINVYNSAGQLVYSKKFPGGGEKYFQVDLGGRAAGTYTVNLGYEDSNRNLSVQVVKY